MTTTHWLLQHNMPSRFIRPMHEALTQHQQMLHYFGYIGESQQIATDPESTLDIKNLNSSPIITRSGTGALQALLSKANNTTLSPFEALLFKGYFYDTNNFDQKYQHQLDIPLLNKDSLIMPMEELIHHTFTEPKFIKPTSDLKGFTASVLPPHTPMAEHLQTLARMPTVMEETCLVSSIKYLSSECRFFVVDGVVITGSFYRCENKPYMAPPTKEYFKIAQEYAQLFQPAKAFVIDIGLTCDHEFKIIEYNCLNCSGTYEAHLPSLIDALTHLDP